MSDNIESESKEGCEAGKLAQYEWDEKGRVEGEEIEADIERIFDSMETPSATKDEPTQHEWVGGLPPVGTECEATWPVLPDGGGENWTKVRFKGGYDSEVWFCIYEFEEIIIPAHNITFRPIKSQAELAADRREASKNEILGILSTPTSDDELIADMLLEWHLSQSKG